MRGGGYGGGGDVYKLLQNYHKTHLIQGDQDGHRLFLLHDNHVGTCIDDQECNYNFIYGDDDGNQDTNFHGGEADDGDNSDEPFNLGDQQEGSMERTMFWESQEALLEEILEQYKSNYSKLRDELSRHIESARKYKFCECLGPNLDGCTNCLRRQVVNLLRRKGFNASLCTSSWKKTHTIPGGKHEYIEVVVSSQSKKRKIKFLIEIEFREEFKMAKACNEYQKLMYLLPETYIGKPEHLNAILRVMCDAAERSTAEKKIHLGPWRKRSFMQMKWSAYFSTQPGLKQEDTEEVGSNLPIPAPNIAVRVA